MKLRTIFLLILFSLPFVSAYNGFSYSYFSPSQLLENEWFFFGLIFLVFFALTFFALGKTMKENIGVAVVISVIIALFIAFAISQRTYYTSYLGETIGSYLLIIVMAVAAILLVRFLVGFGGIFLFVVLFGLWFLLQNISPYDFFPNEFLTSSFFTIYEFLASTAFLIILVVAIVLVLIAAYGGKEGNEKVRNWFWGKKEGGTNLDWLRKKWR